MESNFMQWLWYDYDALIVMMKFQPSFPWFCFSTRLSMKGWNQHKSNHQSTLVPVGTCHNWTLPFSVFVRFSNRQKVDRDPHCTRYKKQMLNIWLMVNPSAKSENFVFHPQSKGFNMFDQPDLLETVHFELLWLCSSMGCKWNEMSITRIKYWCGLLKKEQ